MIIGFLICILQFLQEKLQFSLFIQAETIVGHGRRGIFTKTRQKSHMVSFHTCLWRAGARRVKGIKHTQFNVLH